MALLAGALIGGLITASHSHTCRSHLGRCIRATASAHRQARDRLSKLETRASRHPSARCAGRCGRRYQGAIAGSHRCTGDLINLALPDEFTQARVWLGNVGTAHDVTSHVPAITMPTFSRRKNRLPNGRNLAAIASAKGTRFPFRSCDARAADADRRVFVGTDGCHSLATGRLGSDQLDALDRELELDSDPNFRVLLIHHPLSSKASHKRLVADADALITSEAARRGPDPARP